MHRHCAHFLQSLHISVQFFAKVLYHLVTIYLVWSHVQFIVILTGLIVIGAIRYLYCIKTCCQAGKKSQNLVLILNLVNRYLCINFFVTRYRHGDYKSTLQLGKISVCFAFWFVLSILGNINLKSFIIISNLNFFLILSFLFLSCICDETLND